MNPTMKKILKIVGALILIIVLAKLGLLDNATQEVSKTDTAFQDSYSNSVPVAVENTITKPVEIPTPKTDTKPRPAAVVDKSATKTALSVTDNKPQATNVKVDKPSKQPYHTVPEDYIYGTGVVIKLLPDDTEPPCHQRILLRLGDGSTLLIAHNIEIAPRLDSLRVGDTLEYCGEYIDNDKGGLVHWTHHSNSKKHSSGWLKFAGKYYD